MVEAETTARADDAVSACGRSAQRESARSRPAAGTARWALVALVAGALAIAFSPILVRVSELEPTATGFYRMALSLPLFALWARWERPGRGTTGPAATLGPAAPGVTATPGLTRRHLLWLLVAGLFFAGDLAAWHWSIRYTSVANATLLANLAPIVVTVAAWLLFRERITGAFLVGMLLALGGALLLVRATASSGGTHHLLGDALAALTSLFYAGYLLTVKDLRRSLGTATLMGLSSLVSSVILLGLSLAAGESLIPGSPRGWLVLVTLAWVAQVLGQGLITYGLAHLPAGFWSVTLLVQPVAAALLAWVLLSEPLVWLQGVGAAAVLVGILVARRATGD